MDFNFVEITEELVTWFNCCRFACASGTRKRIELAQDEFSGCVLYQWC